MSSLLPTASALMPDRKASRRRVAERRHWQRVRVDLHGYYQPVPARPDELWWGARVYDISPGGVGIIVHRPIEPGTELFLEITDPFGDTTRPCRLEAIHSRLLFGSGCLVGCRLLAPLSDSDIRILLS